MTVEEFIQQFLTGLRNSSWMERIAVLSGIGSVWFSRKENVLVYPVGLISTIFYIYISYQYHLPGEAAVNLYYTIMSFYGWYWWAKKNKKQEKLLYISSSGKNMLWRQFVFFIVCYITIYFSLVFLKEYFFDGAIPWADALASATAFTGMWLMTRKKTESWYWWIATNIASMPLYFVKGLAMTSVLYFILLIMAVFGLVEWRKREKRQKTIISLHP